MFSRQSTDEKLFRLLVASVKDYAIFMIDTQGYILSWNLGASHIKGYSEEEAIGKHISMFYLPEEIKSNQPYLNLALALANGTFEKEGWRVRKDGSKFWANIIFTPLFNEKQQHVGFAKITRDITEKKRLDDLEKQTQAELEDRVRIQTKKIVANELRFRKLIENSYDGLSLLDENFLVFYRSLSACRINGWNDDERMDIKMSELVHPDDQLLLDNMRAEVLKRPGEPLLIDYRTKHRLGHYIWIECLFTNMLHNEHIGAVVCNFRDITELKQHHQKLKEAADTQTAILNALPPHIALLDENGKIITVNASWKKFAIANGFKMPGYGVGKNYFSVSDQTTGSDYIKVNQMIHGIRQVIKGSRKGYTTEYPCHSKASKRWFQLIAAPIAHDNLKGAVVLHIDITARKLAETSLIHSKDEIDKQNDVLKDIAWISSHEIRRPVASVLGLVNVMEFSDSIEEKEQIVKMIGECAAELDIMVHSIHDKINQLHE